VHIIDPFTGTGTFITRLLQSGLIPVDKLKAKYKSEIHANEIVLLAYYIAAINIEAVYHSLVGGNYVPFEGICLTDTFQLWEKEDLVDELLVQNSARRKKQKKLDIKVIIGNPPYSSGQKNENDDNQNTKYPQLDANIRDTYKKYSTATSTKNLDDSYIRAIRWASDRIGKSGVIGFISGNGFVSKPAMDGMRKCLVEEFSSIYVLNLRGDIRKNMLSKGKAKEGQNIFGSGSMTGIVITLFVKNEQAKEHGKIYYSDIGDDLKSTEKLEKLNQYASVSGVSLSSAWIEIEPDGHNDWIAQREGDFSEYLSMGDKKDKSSDVLFKNYSLGLNSNRDAWVYNFSKTKLTANLESTIKFYNEELARFKAAQIHDLSLDPEKYVSNDETKIKWSSSLRADFARKKSAFFSENKRLIATYRPFIKEWLYFDGMLNHRVGQMPHIFPNDEAKNLVICVSGVGARSGFSTFIANSIPDLHALDTGQCFPLYLYEKLENNQINFDGKPQTTDMFSVQSTQKSEASESEYQRKGGISDAGLAHFTAAYPNEKISKEDVFYYVYGLLHSSDYRERYADNLSKELPRIPCVKTAKDFWHFSQAGRDLAELHLNYETVACYPVTLDTGKKKLAELDDKDFYVTKMKFAKKGEKHTVIYNHQITIRDIPEAAFDYVVNGKAALDWVMERQAVTTHKDSGIVNDANDWATETMGNAKYPLELFQRVITVSLETMKIVNALPKLDI
jgi:predicted helicase